MTTREEFTVRIYIQYRQETLDYPTILGDEHFEAYRIQNAVKTADKLLTALKDIPEGYKGAMRLPDDHPDSAKRKP